MLTKSCMRYALLFISYQFTSFLFAKLHDRHQTVVSKGALCSDPLCHIREFLTIICTFNVVLDI